MKKIAIDARESGTSTGRYIDNLIRNFSELNPPYDITLLAKPHRAGHFRQIAPKFTVVESVFKEFTFAEQFGLLKQLNQLKPDLVHFGMTQQPILYHGKSVTTIHDLTTARFKNPSKNFLVFAIKQIVYKRVIKAVAKKSACLIVPSRFVKEDLAAFTGVKKSKIAVIYEASNKIKDPPEPVRSLLNAQFIMYVGRPQPHKNLQRLVLAFSELKEKHPELKLVLVGKKDILYEQMESYVQKAKIPDVIFTGFVSEGSLRWLYEHTAAYVFPSLSEGFGLPGLEAMAHGASVVSSNATCLPEIYGLAAHYFNPMDIAEMAAKIDDVLSDPKLRGQLIENGQKQVQKYSWHKMARQTLEVYNKELNS